MMRSMWSGVEGLKTHQLEMDVIGNNIANVNSTSYKSQATGFSDIFYQTIKQGNASGDTRATTNASQVGFGSRVASIMTNVTKQGSAMLTDNVLDLMITGDSFFCVKKDYTSTEMNFSRDGALTIDADGYLVTQNSGLYVMGQNGAGNIEGITQLDRLKVIDRNTQRQGVDAKGNPITYMVDTMPAKATSAAYFKGNIDKEDEALEEERDLLLEVFGNDGKTYTLKFKLTDGGDLEDNTYNMSLSQITDAEGNKLAFDNQINIDLVYDKHNGKLTSINGNNTQKYNLTLTGAAGPLVGPLDIDFSTTSNFASSSFSHVSSIDVHKGDLKGQNMGYTTGELVGVSFGTDGSIYGRYSNGQTQKKAQMVVAEFNNAMGLEKIGDGLYKASPNSGNPMYMDITKDGGYMTSGVLEGSNVDLAKEFTDMITTQRGFQANSKVITTSDEMLQLLKSLKR